MATGAVNAFEQRSKAIADLAAATGLAEESRWGAVTLDDALDDALSTIAARFPVRAAVLRRLARSRFGRAVVVGGLLRASGRG